MATIEARGEALRLTWRLGGSRNAARQSVTFRGGTETARSKLAKNAKALVESHGHNLTRDECRRIIFGTDDADTAVPLLRDWVEMWLDGRLERREIQADVVRSYRTILRSRAVPYLGHLRLTEIDHEMLRNWVGWLSSSRITVGSRNKRLGDRLLSPTTIRRTHAILHACLSGAVPKWLTHNPAAKPAGASKHAAGLPKRSTFEGMFLSNDEINLILEHCDPHIRDLVFIAIRSGLRLGELVALQVQHVVFSQDGGATILVRRAVKNDGTIGEPKSVASRRNVTLGPDATVTISALVRGKKPKALVFTSPLGGMWDEHNLRDRYWYRTVAAAMRCPEHPPPTPAKPVRGPTRALRNDEVSTCDCPTRLHRRPRIHDLRHTHASMLIADGWHMAKIQKRLGHASYQTTTSVYSHLLDLGNGSELASLDERLRPRVLAVAPTGRRPASQSVVRRVRRAGVRRLLSRRSGPS